MKTRLNSVFIGSLAILVIMGYGCNEQARGFALPQGDIQKGKQTFVDLGCNSCHSAGQIEWKGNANDIQVPLGGEVQSVKSYGELVTSVINPSHKIAAKYKDTMSVDGVSKMQSFNDVMTVQNLIDIVTFLQSEYDIVPPPFYYHEM